MRLLLFPVTPRASPVASGHQGGQPINQQETRKRGKTDFDWLENSRNRQVKIISRPLSTQAVFPRKNVK